MTEEKGWKVKGVGEMSGLADDSRGRPHQRDVAGTLLGSGWMSPMVC